MGDDQLRKLHRQSSQIDDVDCAARRRSLQGMLKLLSELSLDARVQFTINLIRPLLDRMVDPVEKCRDLALELIATLVNECKSQDLAHVGHKITLTACSRFEKDQFLEPVEEIRLRCVRISPLFPKSF